MMLTAASQKFVGIYAVNRVEWVLTYLGAVAQSITIVPLYDTLGADAVQVHFAPNSFCEIDRFLLLSIVSIRRL